ncbi:twin-arginine translocase TatA/TatE family subunit [Myceligenerans pegani]|uniref:Twin-arginine translocase TatA/TatE family subunit n=1 Tax=Myceligenerans pegani TaxID=2776917 RepID=A0ABR9N0B4_9MICO|nr:twin-arginine translocase TatA/TatE family subunit [Myceligenerans sp. TRM 65318]MBE1877093.1 twin-arginine translocase TatA/TatE family subunit [Myceligenerans sp. TRM 65318]MBE3019364.1 twin-arginine translocase TatA/TatE family subunit [Myceligenerans sp. TRM 65318]
MFGINGWELGLIVILAVVLIGPERLPGYAEQLGRAVRRARGYLTDARSRVDEELGPEFRDVDWSKLDPRQYDPRKIVRDALLDDTPLDGDLARRTARETASGTTPPGGRAPYDDEAT